MSHKLIQIVYVSSSRELLDREELLEILELSQARNASKEITGMLLYHDGNIIQCIEGEEATVDALFQAIGQDPRHKGVIRLLRSEIAERDFEKWSMGFADVGDAPSTLKNSFLKLVQSASVDSDMKRGKAINLIKSFVSVNC